MENDSSITNDNDLTELISMKEIEHRHIHKILKATYGNKKQTAQILGFDCETLYRKLISHKIKEYHSVDVDI